MIVALRIAGCVGSVALVLAVSVRSRADEEAEHRDRRLGSLDLAADLEGAAVVATPHPASGDTLGAGTGFKFRVGDQLHLPLLRITPEVGYGYEHFFSTHVAGVAYDWNTHRVFAGGRLGLGEIIVPTAYAHLGYGWRDTPDPTVPPAGGLAFDAGLALDLHLVPHFGIGAHVEYDTIDSTPFSAHWIALGGHADVAL